jgi:hypothetical protein
MYLWAQIYMRNTALRCIPQIYFGQQTPSVPGTATALISLSHTVSTAGQSVFKHDTFPSGTEIITQNYLCLVPSDIFTVASSFVRFYVIWIAVSEVFHNLYNFNKHYQICDRLCGLVIRVLGYRFGGPVSIPGTTRKKKVVGLERGPLSL